MFAASFERKPIWEVRTRNWKLRGGENRLSGLLEGISVSRNFFYMIEQRFDDVWGLRLGLINQSKLESKWLWILPYILACMRNDAMGSWHVWEMMSWDLDMYGK
ncbi:hypothetical protein GQ457_03G019600 [Hibiscus cannabinus]